MRQTIFTILCALFFIHVQAQTSFFTTNSTNKFYHIKSVNKGGGYITVGQDSVFKNEFVRWDDSFNPIWKIKVTDTNINSGLLTYALEANDGKFYVVYHSKKNTGSIVVMRVNEIGTVLWQKEYTAPGTGTIFAYSFSKASGTNNGFIFGTGNCTLSNCMVECDSNGNITWQKKLSYSPASGVVTCFSIEPDGTDYTVCSAANSNSILTYKVSNTGSVVSYHCYKNATTNISSKKMVKLSNNNGYAVLGDYNGASNSKQFVAIYNTSFSLQSYNDLAVATGTDIYFQDIVETDNGAAVLLCGIEILPNGTSTVYHSFIMKVSNTGTILWAKENVINPSATNKYQSFESVTTKNRNIVCAGYGNAYGSIISIIDSNGNGLCNPTNLAITKTVGALNLVTADALTSLTTTVNVAASNYIYTNNVTVNKTLYCGTMPNEVDDLSTENTFSIFPNPSNNLLTIENYFNTENTIVEIVSFDGKVIFKDYFRQSIKINTTYFTNGIYFVRLSSKNGVVTKKMIVQH